VTAPTPDEFHDSTEPVVVITVCDRDDVLIAKYATSYRWWPAPESRKKGSQRWIAPPVDHWHHAASVEAARASCKARESS
jgi:hypothetical protein